MQCIRASATHHARLCSGPGFPASPPSTQDLQQRLFVRGGGGYHSLYEISAAAIGVAGWNPN
jgi:hypothetical protein